MDPSAPCYVATRSVQEDAVPANRRLPCHCWDRTAATLLNNSQYADPDNIQRRTANFLALYTVFGIDFGLVCIRSAAAAFDRNATANIHKHKL